MDRHKERHRCHDVVGLATAHDVLRLVDNQPAQTDLIRQAQEPGSPRTMWPAQTEGPDYTDQYKGALVQYVDRTGRLGISRRPKHITPVAAIVVAIVVAIKDAPLARIRNEFSHGPGV